MGVRILSDREAYIREIDRRREDRLRQDGIIGGRYDDNEKRAAILAYDICTRCGIEEDDPRAKQACAAVDSPSPYHTFQREKAGAL